jgi:hypothetical protein
VSGSNTLETATAETPDVRSMTVSAAAQPCRKVENCHRFVNNRSSMAKVDVDQQLGILAPWCLAISIFIPLYAATGAL